MVHLPDIQQSTNALLFCMQRIKYKQSKELFVCLRTLRSIRHTWWSRECLRAEAASAASAARRQLDARLLLQAGAAAKLLLDITHAVSCLPRGVLWGERIGAARVAAIATISSVAGIALYFARKRLLK